MKVRELILLLRTHDPDAEVVVEGDENYGLFVPVRLYKVKVARKFYISDTLSGRDEPEAFISASDVKTMYDTFDVRGTSDAFPLVVVAAKERE